MSDEALALAEDAAAFLRRQFVRANLDGSQAPIVVNPRTQGWLFGFSRQAAVGLGLEGGAAYSFQAKVFVRVMDGSPTGEQLGLEAFSMAQAIDTFFGAKDMQQQFHQYEAEGASAAVHFVALQKSLDGLHRTLKSVHG
jgi:hypothetical protein